MKFILNKYKEYFSQRAYLISFIVSIILIIISIIVNYYTGNYANKSASNSVTDIILSNTRTYDLDFIFIYGAYIFWIFFTFLLILKPQRIPFILKSIALFILIRSIFISMTHIGQFPDHLFIDPASFLSDFTFGGDLFFSGHTGIPFLLSLIFWKNKKLRITFILISILFGITVLLAHLHYTIDVLSAFFITYSIYHISIRIFSEDRKLFYIE